MYPPDSTRRRTVVAIAVAAVAVATLAPPVAAQAETDPAFVVELQPDGSAEVTVRSAFDLTTDAERAAFETLTNDEQARQNATVRFADRLRSVARDAETATGREMRVSDASIALDTTANGETGIITLSVTWEGLAAVEDGTLIVTEPFASGFTPDRPFVLRAPDGYAVDAVTPEPDERADGELRWAAGTDLDGFAVELSPGPSADDEARTGGQPGFGAVAAVLAVIVGSAAAAKGRYSR